MFRSLVALLPPFLLLVPAYAEEFAAPALVRSKARIEIRSSLAVPIRRMSFHDGERFAKGDLLVAYDCRTLAAERRAAAASVAAETIDVAAKTRMLKHGAVGRGEVRRAKALLRRASSQREAIAARMRQCEVHAPFDGRVVRRSAGVGETPAPGATVVTVVDDRRLDVEIVAPSRWLAWIRAGARFDLTLEETGTTLPGTVVTIGPEVDPVSRTVRIFGSIDPAPGLLPGMSGNATFETVR